MKSCFILIAASLLSFGVVAAQVPEPPVGSGLYGPNTGQQATTGNVNQGILPGGGTVAPGSMIPGSAPAPPTTSGGRATTTPTSPRSAEIPLPPTATTSAGISRGGGGWVSGQAALSGGPFPGYMTGYPSGQTTAGFGGGTPPPVQKPYSEYTREPSVSPYINLYRPEGAFGTVGNYYSLVRPMVQQQQINRQVSRQINQMQSTMTGGGGYTGRSAGTGGYFMNYYGFYPGLGSR